MLLNFLFKIPKVKLAAFCVKPPTKYDVGRTHVFLRTRFFSSSLQKVSGESAEVSILQFTAVSWSESVNISAEITAAFCISFSKSAAVNGEDYIKCQVWLWGQMYEIN